MSLTSKLNRGLYGWLLFEKSCNHLSVFSEKYMTKAVADILTGGYQNFVVAEYNHQYLKKNSGGRPRQIDFAVLDSNTNELSIAIETKWAWYNTVPIDRILYDFIRLETISERMDVDRYFVLAGKRKTIQKTFNRRENTTEGRNGRTRYLLRCSGQSGKIAIHRHKTRDFRSAMLKAAAEIRDYSLPERLVISSKGIYPQQGNSGDPAVLIFKIGRAGRKLRGSFKPSKAAFFATRKKKK